MTVGRGSAIVSVLSIVDAIYALSWLEANATSLSSSQNGSFSGRDGGYNFFSFKLFLSSSKDVALQPSEGRMTDIALLSSLSNSAFLASMGSYPMLGCSKVASSVPSSASKKLFYAVVKYLSSW